MAIITINYYYDKVLYATLKSLKGFSKSSSYKLCLGSCLYF